MKVELNRLRLSCRSLVVYYPVGKFISARIGQELGDKIPYSPVFVSYRRYSAERFRISQCLVSTSVVILVIEQGEKCLKEFKIKVSGLIQ